MFHRPPLTSGHSHDEQDAGILMLAQRPTATRKPCDGCHAANFFVPVNLQHNRFVDAGNRPSIARTGRYSHHECAEYFNHTHSRFGPDLKNIKNGNAQPQS
jgi:hypothetical protein